MMITQSYNLNLIPGGVPLRVPCSQRDAGSRTVVLNLFNGSERFTSPVSGVIQGTRTDGEAFTAAASVSGGAATFTISLDMTATAGAHTAELILTDSGSNVLGTANFVIDVEAEAMNPDITPTAEEQTIWESMRSQSASLAASAQASATAAAGSAEDAEDSADAAATSAASAQSIVNNAVAALVASADSAPTSGSSNLILSGGVYTAINNVTSAYESTPTEDSGNPATSGALFNALYKFDELWTQSATSYAAATVSISGLSAYDAILIRFVNYYTYSTPSTERDSVLIMRCGDTSTVQQMFSIRYTTGGTGASLCYRTVTVNWTSNNVEFGDNRQSYTGSSANSVSNNGAVPTAIIGIKF